MIANFPYIISQLAQPFNLLLMIVGTAIGIIFGAIPGLSAHWLLCCLCRLHTA